MFKYREEKRKISRTTELADIVKKAIPKFDSKKKYDVTVYDNLLYEDSYRKDCNFINGDIRDNKFYKSNLKKYDTVVWLAALVGDGACAINPALTDEINFQTLKKLCS